MNRTPDVELVLREWLADDRDIAPDRILVVVADRIARQPRRPAQRLPWRPFMNTQLKLLAGLAAAVVVAVVGYNLLPRQPGAGSNPTPSPTPIASSTASSTPIECEDGLEGCSGMLPGGPHRSKNLVPPLAFETTGGSWKNVIDIADVYKIDSASDLTPGYPYILVWTNASIVEQANPCSTDPDPSLGRAQADWIEFVTSHPGIVATDPVDVSFDGITARQVELSVADDWVQTCPNHDGPYVMLLTQRVGDQIAEYGLPSDERLLLTVVNVGQRTAVIQSYGPKDQAAFDAAMEPIKAIIASFRMCGPAIGAGPCGGPGAVGPAST